MTCPLPPTIEHRHEWVVEEERRRKVVATMGWSKNTNSQTENSAYNAMAFVGGGLGASTQRT